MFALVTALICCKGDELHSWALLGMHVSKISTHVMTMGSIVSLDIGLLLIVLACPKYWRRAFFVELNFREILYSVHT